jgi:hypothetical protein
LGLFVCKMKMGYNIVIKLIFKLQFSINNTMF